MPAEPFVAAVLLAAIGFVLLVAGRLRPRRSLTDGPPLSILDLAGALALVGALGCVALILALDSAQHGGREVRPEVPAASPVSSDCPADADIYLLPGSTAAADYRTGALPSGFEPSGAVLCTWEATNSEGSDRAVVEVVQHEGELPDELRAALALPDLVNQDAICAAVYIVPPFLMVTDGRQGVMVRLPEDECRKVRPEVMAVIDSLELRQTRSFQAS